MQDFFHQQYCPLEQSYVTLVEGNIRCLGPDIGQYRKLSNLRLVAYSLGSGVNVRSRQATSASSTLKTEGLQGFSRFLYP